ncbi:putative uvi-1 protein [Phaeoacremonium minimum UCRPA7]|uniref:Putative uvi-1 protein n=1 Tax=Phaeoacremonium minimum (strain UCR-PA7) TaxID=1286976 RepID=R8BIR6_PHAM7|nr:putative uvi-1 protein [Phaeoacremonium minimum UCRPA7]EON99218.1 putative uvi-1 protein [Phaeoacremonium minimum UCRPA7]
MRISVVTALAVFAGVTTAQVNADAICQTLDTLTANVNGLIGQAQSLSILNAPLALVGQGPLPVVVNGLAQVVNNITTCLTQLQPQEIVGDAATSIVTSFGQFAQAQTTLLNTLASKAALCLNLPFILSPITSLLGGLDGSVNALANNLVQCLDDITGGAITDDMGLLNGVLGDTLNRYS